MPGTWGKDQIHFFLHHLYSDCLLDGVKLKDCAAGCNLDVCDGGVNDGLSTIPGILVIRSLSVPGTAVLNTQNIRRL